MKKSIYIIKNDINDMVYIGQSKNPRERFTSHCTPSNRDTYIDRAIKVIGKEHFWFEILEEQIENYNEREKYWIKYYNSIKPNGYNVSIGGENGYHTSPKKGTKSESASIKDETVLIEVLFDLKHSKLSFDELSKKYKVSKGVIHKVNQGRTYRKEDLTYPIRSNWRYRRLITEEEANEIIELIKTTILSFEEIGKKYGVSARYVSKIQNGLIYKNPKESYPLRTGRSVKTHYSSETIDKIYELLLTTNLSLREIGRITKVPYPSIQQIKNGTVKLYRREEYTYPLRSNQFKKPVSTISAKESTTTIDT